MNFHGYQQAEIFTQQVMHTHTTQEEKNIGKISGCRLKFSRQFLKQ